MQPMEKKGKKRKKFKPPDKDKIPNVRSNLLKVKMSLAAGKWEIKERRGRSKRQSLWGLKSIAEATGKSGREKKGRKSREKERKRAQLKLAQFSHSPVIRVPSIYIIKPRKFLFPSSPGSSPSFPFILPFLHSSAFSDCFFAPSLYPLLWTRTSRLSHVFELQRQ